jgi:hypothetical protein
MQAILVVMSRCRSLAKVTPLDLLPDNLIHLRPPIPLEHEPERFILLFQVIDDELQRYC